ncbi:hypothetical protein KC358_g17199, partial [Hortaea werneckii]
NSILPLVTQYIRDNIIGPRPSTTDGEASAPSKIKNMIDALSYSTLTPYPLSPTPHHPLSNWALYCTFPHPQPHRPSHPHLKKLTSRDQNSFTTQFPADLNSNADIQSHDAKMAAAGGKLGLVSGGGTVLRYVDFAPGYECMMHRTQSVDYGIVLEGTIVSVLDSGEEQEMKRGDVMVQRATMHAWKNPSRTEWARMIFCLQDCKPVYVGGQRFGEDLGRGTEGVPASGND